jgi:hypothetical protein
MKETGQTGYTSDSGLAGVAYTGESGLTGVGYNRGFGLPGEATITKTHRCRLHRKVPTGKSKLPGVAYFGDLQ